MNFDDTLDNARKFGAAAAASLSRYGIAPTPAAYAVWYTYHAGHIPDLVSAIATIIAAGNGPTDGDCESLFGRFLSGTAEAKVVEDTSFALQEALDIAVSALRDASEEANDYADILNKTSAALKSSSLSSVPLHDIISALARRTAKTVTHNLQLQGRLQDSATELQTMRSTLASVHLEANTDGLTGVANRRRFDTVLRNEIARAGAENHPFSLIIADVDHFKMFNDTHGHTVGDQVLRSVAGLLTSLVREGDTVARYGGEEFAIILPGISVEQAAATAERLRASVASRKIIQRGSGTPVGSVTMSFGIAEYRGTETAHSLIERADRALYAAKAGNRNIVCGVNR
ncbi:hypothetical protein CHU95_03740 [Niveispirillum lacus]|uniref:diguanylate cyclase n=1 Tax=Niveispirillum lacus TaxID=1981099 RepID=A0A255Z715_9PROT|nr:GGDEF domain-containing protein [Niveispirillum lacus]OYQ36685.1 hypothetical protein CHU95_03740 [Niveispirillum lacus]